MTVQTSTPPDLPDPTDQYDQEYMIQLLDLIGQYFFVLSQRRALLGTTINLSNIPTSSTGLRPGDVWSDSGVLTLVS